MVRFCHSDRSAGAEGGIWGSWQKLSSTADSSFRTGGPVGMTKNVDYRVANANFLPVDTVLRMSSVK